MNVHSSIIHNSQMGETTEMSINDKWINRMWYNNATEYYSTIKRNKVQIPATTWINLKNIILSEGSHKRSHIILFYFYEVSRRKFIGTESRLVVAKGLTTNWFKIGKGVWQSCVLLPCLFNLYAECTMQNAGLDEL